MTQHRMPYRLLCVMLMMKPATGSTKEVLHACLVLESDSYYTSYERLRAVVDLAETHVNYYVLPGHVQMEVTHHDAGPSCTVTQYSAVSNMLQDLKNGAKCDVFIGAGKRWWMKPQIRHRRT